MKQLILIAVLMLTFAVAAYAEIAPLINYQGRLTDDNGAPVPDANYSLTFYIYSMGLGGDLLYSTGPHLIPVSGGLFSFTMGYTDLLPDSLFDGRGLYMTVSVNSDTPMYPRRRLTASPYAFRTHKADSAYGLINDSQYVLAAGDTLSGYLEFDGDGNGISEARVGTSGNAGNINLKSHDSTTVKLIGALYGELGLYHAMDDNRRVSLVGAVNGGNLVLYNNDSEARIKLYGYTTGNDAVQLPEDAIDDTEILNEPGVAFNSTSSSIDMSLTDVLDIITVSITIPAPGYVYVMSDCTVDLYGTTQGNGVKIQIDSTAGGGIYTARSITVAVASSATTSGSSYSGSTSYIFYESSAGTHEYRLEGQKTSSFGTAAIKNAKISAQYFPGSYGSAIVYSDDPISGADAIPVSFNDDNGNAKTTYKVDLRELEMKVKQAQLEEKEAMVKRQEAELELERAKRENE
ncbi:MAG: hypothetical protein R3F48_00795 [Candidatus Zixiibacteriota bacterium]